ncbi:MAG TPA: permease [Candidatus Saccharibacteria bacterium]|jgi:uncharacterized membrane protein YraQ (UPF0718 family)|nr:permease [Candidatus Saccharibacteria bacterium]
MTHKNHNTRVYILSFMVLFLSFTAHTLLKNVSLGPRVYDLATLTLGVLYESVPFVILGIILSTLIQQYAPISLISKFQSRRGFIRRSSLSVSGSFLPVCECGNVPLARGLILRGLHPSDAIVFILAAPVLNPITITTTHQAFPDVPQLLIARVLGTFLIANVVGFFFSRYKQKDMLTKSFQTTCEHANNDQKHTHKSKLTHHISRFSSTFISEFRLLLPSLILGSFLAGTIQTIVPRSILLELGYQPVLAIIVMIVIAFTISICANVDAFFALSISNLFPKSAILAFLIFGPMVDFKMITLLKTTFKARFIGLIVAHVFILTMLFTLGAHYVI